MAAIYLWFNAVVYAGFALLCTLRLDATSRSLGYETLSRSGHSEYITVYGGLQWGLALIFAFFAMRPELHRPGLIVALLLYLPIVVHRLLSLARFAPVAKLTYGVAALEVAMLLAAVALWYASGFHRPPIQA